MISSELKNLEIAKSSSGGWALRGGFRNINNKLEFLTDTCWAKSFKEGINPRELADAFREIADNLDKNFDKAKEVA